MKKLLTILILIWLSLIVYAGEKSLQEKIIELDKHKLPVVPEDWFIDLDMYEKWELLKNHVNNEVELQKALLQSNELLKENKQIIFDVEKLVESNRKFLEKYKPFYPHFGFSVGAYFSISEQFRKDLGAHLDFNIYLLKGRFFISPSIYFKWYETFGGGAGVGLGWNFF